MSKIDKAVVPPDQLREHLIKLRDKHIAQHGRGREADRAMLQEALQIDDLPAQVRIPMQRAYTVRSVATKIFRLREPEQRRLIAQMKLDATGDNELKDYEVAIAAVRRAEERGQLGELDREIDAILADGGR